MPRKAQIPDPLLDAFLKVADKIERAQRALLTVIPTSRDAGAPLEVGLHAFENSLQQARELMPAWFDERVRELHASCENSITQAVQEAQSLHGANLSFEALNVRIGDVLHPLEQFVDAERYLRKQKTKSRPD